MALTTRSLLKRVADAADDRSGRDRLIADMPLPWPEFSPVDLRPALDGMVVSHRQDHGGQNPPRTTSGALHNDTAYGLVEDLGNSRFETVHRRPLSVFTDRKQIDKVRDKALRQKLYDVWDDHHRQGGKAPGFAAAAFKTLGVKRTPQFFVNGKPLMNFGYRQLKSLLDTEVAAQY